MISYLEKFADRMEPVAEIASVICRRNRNQAIESSFGENELDNIIFAVLIHIMERSLTENVRCTLEDIEDFLAKLLQSYDRNTDDTELGALTRYIVKDILQNKGESFKFKIMDHSENKLKTFSVRLIKDIEDDDGVIYYVLEKQGFDMLFRTKEVDDLGFQLEEIRLQKLIERGNYSDASDQSRRLIAMLGQKEIELTLFERRLKNDLNETSGDEYETLLREIEQMLDDEYAVMNEIRKTISKAKNSFSDDSIISDKLRKELAEKKNDIFTIEQNTENILVRQRVLLSHSRELGQLYSEILMKAITSHRTHCYDIEDVIIRPLEEYDSKNTLDIEEIYARLLGSLLTPKLPSVLDLRLIYEPQQLNEEITGEADDDVEQYDDSSEYKKEAQRKNYANTEIVRLMLEFASRTNEFRLSELWEYCLENAEATLLSENKRFFLVMLKLYEFAVIDIDRWKREDNKSEDSQGEFDLSYSLSRIYSQDESIYDIKRILIASTDEKVELSCVFTDEKTGLDRKVAVMIDNMRFIAEVEQDA